MEEDGAVRRIVALDVAHVQRLHAGQVIVDLCSIVKELLENALDAGATSVGGESLFLFFFVFSSDTVPKVIELKQHGAKGVEVTDNGAGIAQSEYGNVARKHFTSKLASFGDLASVGTFGFRGEALAALANVAKLTLVTRQTSDAAASRLEYDSSGELTGRAVAAHPVGTTVCVEEVFRSLPVRQEEFVKNIKREFAKVVPLVQSYALACPEVKIALVNVAATGKRQSLFASSGKSNLKENAALLFGAKDAQSLDAIRAVYDELHGVTLDGLISSLNSNTGRRSKDRHFFFLNRRPVDLAAFGRAATECFRSASPNAGKYPTVILSFSVPGSLLDVNVTPEKRTVFVAIENALLEAVRGTIAQHYGSAAGCVAPLLMPSTQNNVFAVSKNVSRKEREVEFEEEEGEEKKKQGQELTAKRESESMTVRVQSPKRLKVAEEQTVELACDLKSISRRLQPRSPRNATLTPFSPNVFEKSNFARMAVVGQFNNGFIVTRLFFSRDLFIVDQHSSNEIFNFEYLQKTTVLRSQPLIAPQTLNFSLAEEIEISANLEVFRRNGFLVDFDESGPPGQRLRLLARPESKDVVFGETDLRELAGLLRRGGSGASGASGVSGNVWTVRPSRVRAMFASRACRMSVMIGDALSREQMRKIVSDLATLEAPWACPHGRPTFLHLFKIE
jgi:DNA mismatch repair protein MutL